MPPVEPRAAARRRKRQGLRAFYSAVLKRDLEQNDDGPNPIVALTGMSDPGVSGYLYPGKPAAAGAGPTIHLAAPDGLDATAERVRKAGGALVSEPIRIPAGSFFYATAPGGNSIGFFET